MQATDVRTLLARKMVEEIEDYAVLLLDTSGNVASWNRGAEKVKGYTADEIIGRNFQLFYTPEDQAAGRPLMLISTAAATGRARDEGWRVRKDGSRFWGSIVITAIHDDDRRVIGFTKVTRDLTANKKAEEAQERYLQQLENRNREMEQLTYIASHDLQQPLRTITNFLSMFESKYAPLVDAHGRLYIDLVMKAAGRMRELIRAMLEYSTLGNNKTVEQVDMQELLEEVKQDLHEMICSTGAVVEGNGLPVLQGYRLELRQLLQNLISNGLKFQRAGVIPHITVMGERSWDKWLFCVKDNGIGIAEEAIPKIFMMFQRLHSKDEYPGAGIGLAYAKKIVTLHNGQIWAQSDPGRGSRFYFSIPFTL